MSDVRVRARVIRVNSHLKMQSFNRQLLFDSMNSCVKKGRAYQYTNPKKAMKEIEKLGILSEVLESVRNFETKLLSDLDVD